MQVAASTRAVLRLILPHFCPTNHVLNNFLFGLLPLPPRSPFLAPFLLHPMFSSFLSSSPHSPTSLSSSSNSLVHCLSCHLFLPAVQLPNASADWLQQLHCKLRAVDMLTPRSPMGTFSIHGTWHIVHFLHRAILH